MIPIQIQLHKKQKNFLKFFSVLLKSRINFKSFESKDDPHRFCIFEVTDSENVVREMFKKSRFRGWFDKQYGKRAKVLLKYSSQHLYRIHWSLARKLCSKMSLILSCKILGLLVNTLAVAEKYLLLHRHNSRIPIQMQLSQKQKIFSQFFAPFLKF